MRKRFFRAAMVASVLLSAGCLERMCERHGYYPPTPPPAYGNQCCVPCCPPAATGYVAPASGWAAPASCPTGCVPANR